MPGCTPIGVCSDSCAEGGEGGESPVAAGGKISSAGGAPVTGGASMAGAPAAGGRLAVGGAPWGGEGGDSGAGGRVPVVEEGLEVRTASPLLLVRRGESVQASIELTRLGDFDGPVQVRFSQLPGGVISGTELLTGEVGKVDISLLAAGDAALGGPHKVRLEAMSLDGDLSAEAELELIVADEVGTLDRDFGDDGVLLGEGSTVAGLSMDDERHIYLAVNVQADENYGLVRRANADGAWEEAPSFEPPNEGHIGTAISAFAFDAESMWLGVQAYNVGEATKDGVLRLGLDGHPIATFGEAGFVETSSAPTSIVLRPEGAFVLGTDATLLALTNEGASDESFNLYSGDCLSQIAADNKGNLFVSCIDEPGMALRVLKVLGDGSLDESFGERGELAIAVGGTFGLRFNSILDQSDGAFLLTYTESTSGKLISVNEAGALVGSFGSQGMATLDPTYINPGVPFSTNFVTAGILTSAETFGGMGVLHLFDEGGSLQTSFGSGGELTINSLIAELNVEPDFSGYWRVAADPLGAWVVLAGGVVEDEVGIVRMWL